MVALYKVLPVNALLLTVMHYEQFIVVKGNFSCKIKDFLTIFSLCTYPISRSSIELLRLFASIDQMQLDNLMNDLLSRKYGTLVSPLLFEGSWIYPDTILIKVEFAGTLKDGFLVEVTNAFNGM